MRPGRGAHHLPGCLAACDEIEVDLKTMHLLARGNVILDQGQSRMACSRWSSISRRRSERSTRSKAFFPPTYHFRGEEIEKLDETHFRLHRGLFTSCELSDTESPPWSIDVQDAIVEVEGYGHFRDAALRRTRLPVFYTPRLLWPIKRDRAAGLMVPDIGYTNQRGAYLGNTFFWPISRSVDASLISTCGPRGIWALGSGVSLRSRAERPRLILPYFVWDPEDETALGVEGDRQAQPALSGRLRAPRRTGSTFRPRLLPELPAHHRPERASLLCTRTSRWPATGVPRPSTSARTTAGRSSPTRRRTDHRGDARPSRRGRVPAALHPDRRLAVLHIRGRLGR